MTAGLAGVMPWYCDLPGFVSDRFESCIPTAEQQVAIMKENFGPGMDPNRVSQATSDYQSWLNSIAYDETRNKLIAEDVAAANPLELIAQSIKDGIKQGLGLDIDTTTVKWAVVAGAGLVALMVLKPSAPSIVYRGRRR